MAASEGRIEAVRLLSAHYAQGNEAGFGPMWCKQADRLEDDVRVQLGTVSAAAELVAEYDAHGIDLKVRPWLEQDGADLELARRRSGQKSLSDEAKKLGVRLEQLQDANAAGLTARLVAEAGYEAEAQFGSVEQSSLSDKVASLFDVGIHDREFVMKLMRRVADLEAAWAQQNRQLREATTATGAVLALKDRVGVLEQKLEGPFTCPDHEDLLQKVEALEGTVAHMARIDLSPNESFMDRQKRSVWLKRRFGGLANRVAVLEARLDAPPRYERVRESATSHVDPMDAAVEAGLLRPDTPETLDPDLSDEAQMEARVEAVTKVIGEAIGVVKGVCEPSAVRAIVSHHLDHAMDAAKDAARVKAP